MSSRLSFKMDSKWLLIFVVLLSVVITSVMMNTTHDNQENHSAMNSSIDIDNGDLKINWNRFTHHNINLSSTVTITNSGVYHLTGSLDDENIIVKVTNGKVKLILDNVTIKNSTGPAIACYAADDLVIELVGENVLEDGKNYSADYDENVAGVIYSKADLTFQGDGSLKITANYQDGIVGKDDIKFNSGAYEIAAVDDGIRGKDSVYIVDGNFDITAKGDAIKSDNDATVGKGFVLIENGDISISVGDDGIHAYNKLIINGGTINILKSYEGFEAQTIIINNGDISIASNDDGINAGGGSDSSTSQNPFNANANCSLTISGGNVYINASGDGVDSNGYIYFDGGTTVIDGPTNNGNGALDSGIGITQTGGTVIAVGASGMAETLGENSSIYSASIYFDSTLPAGTEVKIKNSDSKTIIRHTSAKSFSHMSVGTENFKKDETYVIYVGGEEYKTFTISSTVTMVGENATSGMAPDMTPDNMMLENMTPPGDIESQQGFPGQPSTPPNGQYRR